MDLFIHTLKHSLDILETDEAGGTNIKMYLSYIRKRNTYREQDEIRLKE